MNSPTITPTCDDVVAALLRHLASLAATVETSVPDDEMRDLAHRDLAGVLAAVHEMAPRSARTR